MLGQCYHTRALGEFCQHGKIIKYSLQLWLEIYNLPAKVDKSKNEWIIIFEISKNVGQ